MDINKLINDAYIEILVNKNPARVINEFLQLINVDKINNKTINNTLAFAYFENGNYQEASKIYLNSHNYYQAGFCELLLGNKDKARELWFNAEDSPVVCWSRCLIDMIEVRVELIPSFLQIRNHLECDLSYFIQAKKLDYAENVIQCSEFLSDINPETNKFIGKALMNNGFPNLAVNFFLKSKDVIPNDPEIYYHLAQYSFQINSFNEARLMLKQCLDLNQYYTPARNLLDKIGKQLLKPNE
jgi:tetratricopeptide (TPR) repeat protein